MDYSKPPEHLGTIATEQWRHSVEQLDRLGLLDDADAVTLELYCSAYERYRKAEARVQDEGEIVVSRTGYASPSPWVGIMHRNLEVCRRFILQYGMTPASRAKIKQVKAQTEIPTEWQGVLGGNAD